MKTKLNEAARFHGHLGPYLVLGILAGEAALNRLRCRKYFGLEVQVRGAGEKPKSCLIDGLQLSTGATYGKGNIEKRDGPEIIIKFKNRANDNTIVIKFKEDLIERLKGAKTHGQCEALAKELSKTDYRKIFYLT